MSVRTLTQQRGWSGASTAVIGCQTCSFEPSIRIRATRMDMYTCLAVAHAVHSRRSTISPMATALLRSSASAFTRAVFDAARTVLDPSLRKALELVCHVCKFFVIKWVRLPILLPLLT